MYYFSINDEINLTPGEIVALAGDFFEDAGNPISFGKSLKYSSRSNQAKKYEIII